MDLETQWSRLSFQIDPKGPGVTDLMRILTGAQGTMGIVIWVSVRCELIPAVHRYMFVPGEKLEDLVEFSYQAERIRIGDEMMTVNAAQLATMIGSSAGEIESLKDSLPAWTVVVGLAGAGHFPAERVEVQELDLKRLAQKCQVPVVDGVGQIPAAAFPKTFEKTSGETYYKLRQKGGCQDIFFLTTLDKAPKFVETVFSIAERHRYATSEIGVYIQPQHQGVSQHVEFNFPFDAANRREAEKVKQIYTEASEALISGGAYFSRPYGKWAEMVYGRDVMATRVLRVVKHIVDPKNVLNPGKLCF
jgi:FAD/FMN-containing dehydrogenase